MNIIIVGSGKVGFALAREFSKSKHDITVIDTNDEVLESSSNMLDVNCISGSGISLDILRQAGASYADIIITVTGNDEMNIVVSVMAKSIGAKNTVARIRNPEYTKEIDLLKQGLGINRIINPEYEAAAEISRLLALPLANKVDTFGGERVEIAEYTMEENDLLANKTLDKIHLPKNVLICGLERAGSGEFIIGNGKLVCEPNDRIYLSGTLVSLNSFFKLIGHSPHKTKNIMIIGGSRTAVYLARLAVKMGIKVRLIERDKKRSLELSKLLDECLIICGDGTDEETLLSEDLRDMDAFVSLTDSDEENILSAYFARKQGVAKVIPKINRENYLVIAEQLGLESAVCPKLVTSEHMLRYSQALDSTRSDAMQKLFRVADGKAEAIEFIVPADSRTIGVPFDKLPLVPDVLIAAVVRGKEIIIPSGKNSLKAGDQILIFTKNFHMSEVDDILK